MIWQISNPASADSIAKDKLIFALDVSSFERAIKYRDMLIDHVGMFKIGFELFLVEGPFLLKCFKPKSIMLDLKLLDIPETVERAVSSVGYFESIKFMTVHIGQRAMLERAVKSAQAHGITLLGVTVLSSMDGEDLLELGYDHFNSYSNEDIVLSHVMRRVEFGISCGLKGFVCSPKEVSLIRQTYPDLILVVPGIRPAGSESGDQKRVETPELAVADGASYIVVGRPIRDAVDPAAAADSIAEAIANEANHE